MALLIRTLFTPLGANSGKFTIQLHGVNDSWIPSLKNVGDYWARLGQAGSGSQITGTRGSVVNGTGWHGEPDKASALAFIANFEALETEICLVQDDWGRTLNRVRLTNCSAVPRSTFGPVIASGSQVRYRVECSWSAEVLPNG